MTSWSTKCTGSRNAAEREADRDRLVDADPLMRLDPGPVERQQIGMRLHCRRGCQNSRP